MNFILLAYSSIGFFFALSTSVCGVGLFFQSRFKRNPQTFNLSEIRFRIIVLHGENLGACEPGDFQTREIQDHYRAYRTSSSTEMHNF